MTNDDDLRTAVTKLADKWNNEAGALDPEAEIRALLAAHPAPETVAEMLAREATDAETMPVAEGPYVRNRPTPAPDTRREIESALLAYAKPNGALAWPGNPTVAIESSAIAAFVEKRLTGRAPDPTGHEFIGVAGHPDDDECTYLADAVLAAHPAPPVVDEATLEREARVEIIERLGREVECADGPRRIAAFVNGALYAAARPDLVVPAPPVVDEASIRERIAQEIEVSILPNDDSPAADWLRTRAARIARGATR